MAKPVKLPGNWPAELSLVAAGVGAYAVVDRGTGETVATLRRVNHWVIDRGASEPTLSEALHHLASREGWRLKPARKPARTPKRKKPARDS